MTKQEIQDEFILKLLVVVDQCDREIYAAYKKRQLALWELNEWFALAREEATNDTGRTAGKD